MIVAQVGVKIAIQVIIGKGDHDTGTTIVEASFLGAFDEGAVALIEVEAILTIIPAHKEIEIEDELKTLAASIQNSKLETDINQEGFFIITNANDLFLVFESAQRDLWKLKLSKTLLATEISPPA